MKIREEELTTCEKYNGFNNIGLTYLEARLVDG